MLKALDLFCGAGGVSVGLVRAGFDVRGIDIEPQPNYPFWFLRGDAFKAALIGYDLIWASPRCQRNSALRHLHKDREYPDQITPIRERLIAAGVPYVIENVVGATLVNPVTLCGSMFGLNVQRHREFECSFPVTPLLCQHYRAPEPIDVTGTGGRRLGQRMDGKGGNSRKPLNLQEARTAMGIEWMSRKEISQAIPPAYSKYIGHAAIRHIEAIRAAA